MLLEILRYLRGCISIKVYGGFLEDFINRCSEENIKMWDIRYIEHSMYFFAVEKDLLLIDAIARQSGLELQINSKFGLPNKIKSNKNRITLLIGTAVALAFVGLMNMRIWAIEVTGNEEMFDSEVLQIINELGVNIGTRKSTINAIEVQNKFLELTKDRVLWVSLNVEGMCAEVQIREIEKAENKTIGIPCNYVADFSGIITTYRVFSGTPAVDIGAYVRTGDMLINSVIEYYDNGLNFTEADGLIIARRDKEIETQGNLYAEKRKYTETNKKYAISIFGFEIPFTFSDNENENIEITRKDSFLEINSTKLPFGIIEYTYSIYDETLENLIDKGYILEKYISEVELQTRASNVISVETSLKNVMGTYEYIGKIDCLDFIGEKVPFNIENID